MPKLKSNRGAAKRFRKTKNGLKYRKANRNHILTKKAPKRKRHLRGSGRVKDCDSNSVERLLHGS